MPSNLTQALFAAGKSMAANAVSQVYDVGDRRKMTFQVVWTGQTSADATVKIQESLDGTTWLDVGSGSVTLDSALKKKLGPFTVDLPKVQAVLTKNTETTGTVGVIGFFQL